MEGSECRRVTGGGRGCLVFSGRHDTGCGADGAGVNRDQGLVVGRWRWYHAIAGAGAGDAGIG